MKIEKIVSIILILIGFGSIITGLLVILASYGQTEPIPLYTIIIPLPNGEVTIDNPRLEIGALNEIMGIIMLVSGVWIWKRFGESQY